MEGRDDEFFFTLEWWLVEDRRGRGGTHAGEVGFEDAVREVVSPHEFAAAVLGDVEFFKGL